MNFFILLLASFALGADLSTVSVSPESVNIRTTTIYHVNLRTITTIPSGGSIKIVFPSLFTSLTSGSVECAATSLQSSCSPACTFSGNSMTLQNCFPQTSATIRIDLYNIKNPDYAGTSSSFQIFTYDASASNLDQRTSGVALTFNYAIMNSVELTTGTQITGENSVWTVKFNINYSIIAGGYLSLSFPLWSEGLGSSIQMYYCSGSQVCTGIQNIQITPACSCSQNTLTVNLSSGISAGTVIFTVDSIRNPFSTASVSGFSLTTGATLGVIEKSDNINVSVIVSIPKELTVDPIIIASPTTINEETAYTLSFSCSNPIPLGAIIIVDFPSDLTVNESITSAVQRIFGLSSAISYSVSGNSITLANGFTSYLLENSSIIFSVVNVLNPSSTKPTSVIKISLNTSSGSLVCAAGDNPALKVTATAGSLNNVSIVPEVATINAKTIYSFSFESADPLPIGAGIKITLPPDMSVEESARKKCVYIFPTSVLSQNSQCQSGGSSYIYLTQGFTTGYSSGIISFQIENVINPMTPAITDSIVIETYTDSSFEYLIGTDSSLSIQASSGSLSSVMILPKTLVTGEDVNYMFIIFTSNTIPIKGHIFIQFPPEIVILKLNAKCLNLSGFESTFTCTLTGSSITITRGFETGSFSPGSLSFSVDSVMNPSTTKTSSSFKIYTYSYGYIIDSMITGLTITSETPHPLISASISSSSSFVGEYADFTFSMTPFNPFYNNGAIIITSPSEITFPQAPNCVVGTVISSITCSLLDDRTLKAAVTLNSDYTGSNFHFVVKNIQNPKTTRETSSFTLTTMIDNYLIDSSSSEITVQATNPSQLSQLSIIPTASGINEITTYKVTLLNTYTIPLGGYISIILPPEIIIASTMKCKYADSYINCQNMGSNTIHLYLFPNDFNSALLNFQIENLINWNLASASGVFRVTTYTSDGFSIETDASKVVSFTCYSPCATCSLTPYTCLTCITTSSQPYFWNNECKATCQEGYFDPFNSKTCSKCDSNCKACAGNEYQCTSCLIPGQVPYLYSGKCLASCPTNTFEDANMVCIDCDSNCNTCSEISTKCSSCASPYLLHNSKCVDSCDLDKTLIKSGECFDCNVSCAKCEDRVDKCVKCDEFMFLHRDTCIERCPLQTTITIDTTCYDCKNPCAECSGSVTECSSCVSGYSLHDSTCVSRCPDFYASIDNVCEKCSLLCLSCSGSPDHCTECNDGMYVFNGDCLSACPISETILIERECVPCLASCKTCSGTVDNCDSCNLGLSLYNYQCVSECPFGFIDVNSICEKCDSSCESCLGFGSNCTSCELNTYLYQNTCLGSCPEDITVLIGSNCFQCDSTCITCRGFPNYCELCSENKLALHGSCHYECPAGYEIQDGKCLSSDDLLCSLGCADELLYNGVCDEACNVTSCNYDNGICLAHVIYMAQANYSTTLPISQSPLPATISGAVSAGVIGASKAVSRMTSGLGASIGVLGIIEAASWVRLTSGVWDANSTHGAEIESDDNTSTRRMLSEYDDEEDREYIKIGFGLLIVILFFHFVGNIVFTLVVYFVVIKKDSALKQWIRMHPCANALYLVFSCIVSFKFIRFFISSFCGLSACTARLDRKTNLYKPILIMTYISLGVTTIPVLCISIYILSTFTTGNVVFLQALDTLIITLTLALLHVFDLIHMHKEIKTEGLIPSTNNRDLEMNEAITSPLTEALEYETFKIYDQKDTDQATNVETTRLDYWELDNSNIKPQTHMRLHTEPESEIFTPIKSVQYGENAWDMVKGDEFQEIDELNDFDFSLYNPDQDIMIKDENHDEINSEVQSGFGAGNPLETELSMTDGSTNQDFLLVTHVETNSEEKSIGQEYLVDESIDTDHEEVLIEQESGFEKAEISGEIQNSNEEGNFILVSQEATIDRNEERTSLDQALDIPQIENYLPQTNDGHFLIINQESGPSVQEYPSKADLIETKSESKQKITEESPHPAGDYTAVDQSTEENQELIKELMPKEPDSSISEPDFSRSIVMHLNFELDDSSREFIDDENEPQLLETIPEESYLDISVASVDEIDPECIRVQHRPSGLKVLVKQEFKGGELEDGNILDTSMYEIHEIDEDVHYAILKRSNSDTLIRVRRDFKGARIVDVELRVGGRWMIGRVVVQESDFDFRNAIVDTQDPECVIVTHNVTGFKFRVLKVFTGSPRVHLETGAVSPNYGVVGNYDPSDVIVERDDVHYAWINYQDESIRARRSFVGGMILDILTDNEVRNLVFNPEQTAYFEPDEMELYVIPSNNESQISSILPSSNPPEENVTKKSLPEFLPPFEESKEEPKYQESIDEDIVEVHKQSTDKELLKEATPEEEKIFDSILISNMSSRTSMKTDRSLFRFTKHNYGSDEEEQESRVHTSINTARNRRYKKRTNTTVVTKASSTKKLKNSSKMHSQESLKNIEAIYLQRLQSPSPTKPKKSPSKFHNLMSPESEYDGFSHEAYESMSNLSMKPKASELDIEMIRKKYNK